MWVVCPELRVKALNQQDTVSVEITYRLDLLQVDLRSFLASGASFLGREKRPSERRSRRRFWKSTYRPMYGNLDCGFRESFACGIRNPGNFCLWNSEFSPLESWNTARESGIPLTIAKSAPLTKTQTSLPAYVLWGSLVTHFSRLPEG